MTGRKSSATRTEARPAGTPGSLYLVATPIGNLEDISLRALRILREARWVACEDTRHTGKLLRHHGITTRMVSYHDHNEQERSRELVAALARGEDVALVSDAGTPLVSDPGFRLVRAAIDGGIRVVPLPGPSAVLAALAAAGLPCEEFLYAGFLPARRGERRRALERLRAEPRTIVLFEAPHRLAGSLADAAELLGARPAAVGRELTKVYEEMRRGRLDELAAHYAGARARGEITLVIGPADGAAVSAEAGGPSPATGTSLAERVAEIMNAEGLARNAALKRAAHERGMTRREAYNRLLSEQA
ncbi:MAG TPA: 16S rRNA (cytidine(1402)-2'-O)-methyltransferase [Candidatus Acidoferrales bacterium]|nr:16S rRNA (cytidine(1402)-2'-O)-methyltransferase [Candidatus Acidoferrales bacterium]